MFTVVIIMVVGMLIGFLLREKQRITKYIDTIVTWAIFLLLFLLGVSVGSNKTILNNIDSILLSVIVLTIGAVFGSVIVAYFTYKFLKLL